MTEIAISIGASLREVTRWSAGDTRPLPIYDRGIHALPLVRPESWTPVIWETP